MVMRMPRRAWRIAIVVLLIAAGSTAVVIATVFLLPGIIWVVDMAFVTFLTKVLNLW
jgi:hypothetical protein